MSESGVYHPSPSRAEIKERVELYLYYPTGSRLNFTLPSKKTKRKVSHAPQLSAVQPYLRTAELEALRVLNCANTMYVSI